MNRRRYYSYYLKNIVRSLKWPTFAAKEVMRAPYVPLNQCVKDDKRSIMAFCEHSGKSSSCFHSQIALLESIVIAAERENKASRATDDHP